MSTPTIKIKVNPRTVIKGKMDVRFPAMVYASSPILLDKANGIYTISLDVNTLIESLPPGGVTSVFGRTGDITAQSNDYTFAQIGTKPTTIAGYGITDGVTGPASSVDGEIALFNSTTGKVIKRASTTGLLKAASGVLSAATAGTDYYNPGGTDVAVADGGTGSSTASGARTNLGLGTAATQNTGTSGANVPLLNGANTWSGIQTTNAKTVLNQTVTSAGGSAEIGQDQFVTRASGSDGSSTIGNRTYFTDNGSTSPASTVGYSLNMQYSNAANASGFNFALQMSGLVYANIAYYAGVYSGCYVDTGKTLTAYNAFRAAAPTGPGSVTTKYAFLSDAGAGPIVQNDTTASTSTTTGALQVAGGVGIAGRLNVAAQVGIGKYTVATLPSGAAGQIAFASNCRVFNGAGTQEGAGSGTGGLVSHNGTAWKIAGTNITAVA